jgi:TPR repeat protein
VKWATEAAKQGHVLAQYNLAIMLADGRGVPKNDAEATHWFRIAAEQGYVLAQSSVGLRYSEGIGTPKDLVQAYKWISLAMEHGDSRAKANRDALRKQMTPAQIAQAKKLAGEWKPSHQPPR